MSRIHETPPDARRAASVLFVRDGDDGIEVLMLRRAERGSDPRSGAAVFPGGALDAADRAAHRWTVGPDDAEFSDRLKLPEGGLDYAVAALRESFEEVALLLACRADGTPFDAARHAAALHAWREQLQRGEGGGVAALCEAFDLRLDTRGLAYYSHWLTPPGSPKRFDTRFFMALAPHGQEAVADLGEAQELMWITPKRALDGASELKLLPVTRRTLSDVARFGRAEDAYGEARERRDIPFVMPRRAQGSGGLRVVLPHEWAYAEIGKLDPDGHHQAWSEITAGKPIRLSPRIVRVTAPNPGPMTGPGTNSYFVGDPAADRWALIDPGPADPVHIQALQAAAPGTVVQILATHTHIDHSPGAVLAAEAFRAPVYGKLARYPERQDRTFAPIRELEHGETIALGPETTLRVIHTPGHASNHLCYLLEQEKLLFTGDHVMQGSTVVINPPDGDMQAYLKALHGLLALDIEWLAPGHGFLVAEPHDVVRALIAHRLRREAKVAAALAAAGEATIDELLPAVYDDVAPALYPVARRSLLAHLQKLVADGRATGEERARWRMTP